MNLTLTKGGEAVEAVAAEASFLDLPPADQETVLSWIDERLMSRTSPNYRFSGYYLRTILVRETRVAITNSQFNEAMEMSGYFSGTRKKGPYLNFNVSSKSPALCPEIPKPSFAY